MPPTHAVVALGTPASDLGPSGYPDSGSVVAFSSSTASGSTCKSAKTTLASVSLFDGAVTASRVEATEGKGTVADLEIDGNAVSAKAGQTMPVESWGQLTLGETVGRLTAPLVLRLLQDHKGLLAGTRIAIAFSAVRQPTEKHHSSPRAHPNEKTLATSQRNANRASTKKHRRQPPKPPPEFPASTFPFLLGGGLAPAASDNRVVSIATRYLGIPYLWGGASPKTGFDCSGLVKYVFAQLGVTLPHYAAAQWDSPDAVSIPPKRLRPGDLVFFIGSDGTRKAPGHVGIYVGDGYLIDAPHTGSFVRVDSLNERSFANQYVGARRIVGASLDSGGSQSAGPPTLPGSDLLGVTTVGTSVNVGHLFPPLIRLSSVSEVPAIAAAGTGALRHASRGDAVWVGAGVGGLFLLFGAGVLLFHHRRLG